jgi:hypothetical protein
MQEVADSIPPQAGNGGVFKIAVHFGGRAKAKLDGKQQYQECTGDDVLLFHDSSRWSTQSPWGFSQQSRLSRYLILSNDLVKKVWICGSGWQSGTIAIHRNQQTRQHSISLDVRPRPI